MSLVVVVGGPNGSGKTTLTSHLIKRGRIKTDVINPDEIALKEYGGYKFQIKAARAAIERRRMAIASNSNFAFETTFSGNSEINDILKARSKGFKTILYYVALESLLDNIIRVEERKNNRGHNVELEDLIRRFNKSQINLFKHIALFDVSYLFDNSGAKRSRVAIFEKGKLVWLNAKHTDHPFYKELFNYPPPAPPLLQG